ncbi:MAG: hypothetical protein FJY86_04400 [Candidatus Diapherotrites archaeon]|uniref:Vitamin K epoxide reductase domain-containing protein n=1 Tax=Candidatus Iainarchaeum sp. TaxID=3101447 RepID=A0A8T4C7V9_9ARCH|nr:hypothetical protein [Candidatus Diapherotrites archaeon]
MNTKDIPKYILLVALAGVLFSGWLTYTKVITGNCPLREGCPYLLGLPTCVYGFIIFGTILVLTYLWHSNAKKYKGNLEWISRVALFGILFSGYYSFIELMDPSCPIKPCVYSLLLPSCVYGLVMYVVVFWLTTQAKK